MCPNLSKTSSINSHYAKQNGSMIVIALFVIVVVSLLAAALVKIVSASSNSTIHQVYGVRAQQSAKAGIQSLLQNSFAVDGSAQSCNTSIVSPSSFSNVPGLTNCSYAATCATETISFANVDRLYFKFTSTGSCLINNNVVSRTLSVDAIQELSP